MPAMPTTSLFRRRGHLFSRGHLFRRRGRLSGRILRLRSEREGLEDDRVLLDVDAHVNAKPTFLRSHPGLLRDVLGGRRREVARIQLTNLPVQPLVPWMGRAGAGAEGFKFVSLEDLSHDSFSNGRDRVKVEMFDLSISILARHRGEGNAWSRIFYLSRVPGIPKRRGDKGLGRKKFFPNPRPRAIESAQSY